MQASHGGGDGIRRIASDITRRTRSLSSSPQQQRQQRRGQTRPRSASGSSSGGRPPTPLLLGRAARPRPPPPPPFQISATHRVVSVLAVLIVLGVCVALFYGVEALHVKTFVACCVALVAFLLVVAVPEMTMMGLSDPPTYREIRDHAPTRHTFLLMSMVTIPTIAVCLYIKGYEETNGIEHLPLLAQAALLRGSLGIFYDIYRASGQVLITVSKWRTARARRSLAAATAAAPPQRSAPLQTAIRMLSSASAALPRVGGGGSGNPVAATAATTVAGIDGGVAPPLVANPLAEA